MEWEKCASGLLPVLRHVFRNVGRLGRIVSAGAGAKRFVYAQKAMSGFLPQRRPWSGEESAMP